MYVKCGQRLRSFYIKCIKSPLFDYFRFLFHCFASLGSFFLNRRHLIGQSKLSLGRLLSRRNNVKNIVETTFDFNRGAGSCTRDARHQFSPRDAPNRIKKSQHPLDARIYIIHRGSRAHWTNSDTQLAFSSPSMLSSCVVESSPEPPVCTEPRFSLVELRLIGGPPRLKTNHITLIRQCVSLLKYVCIINAKKYILSVSSLNIFLLFGLKKSSNLKFYT